jgi:serine/threonine-protein kinase RsbW
MRRRPLAPRLAAKTVVGAPPPDELRLSIVNRIETLGDHLDAVDAFLRAWNVDGEDHAQVMIILDEVASNIIHSAWPEGGQHHFDIVLQIVGQAGALSLLLIAVDDGIAFDPTAAPPPDVTLDLDDREPGGLGLFMVREMSESIGYSRVDGVNRLQVAKQLQRAA